MWPLRVVVFPPALDDDLGFSEGVEDLSVQQFVTEPSVEALNVAVFPRAAWLNEGGLGAKGFDPGSDILGNELRAVVASHECRWSAQDEQVSEGIDHVGRVQLTLHTDCQAVSTELVQDVQCSEWPAAGFVGSGLS